MNQWTVNEQEENLSLVQFLAQKLNNLYSNKKIRQAIDQKCCKINGKIELIATRKLKTKDQIFFVMASSIIYDPKAILFEDEHFLAYNKPPFINSVDSSNSLEFLLKKKFPSLIPLHRLDKETTGVILFAKNPQAARAVLFQFKERTIKKSYVALIWGIPRLLQDVIENFLTVIEKKSFKIKMGVASHGEYAKTKWELIKKGKKSSLLQCFPETGRTHQIRVHLSHVGLPIIGDSLYGDPNLTLSQKAARLMLHANQLEFFHPISLQKILIQAPLPPLFSQLLE